MSTRRYPISLFNTYSIPIQITSLIFAIATLQLGCWDIKAFEKYLVSFYPCKGMLLVVVLHMYIPLYILAQCRALESTVAISLKSAN